MQRSINGILATAALVLTTGGVTIRWRRIYPRVVTEVLPPSHVKGDLRAQAFIIFRLADCNDRLNLVRILETGRTSERVHLNTMYFAGPESEIGTATHLVRELGIQAAQNHR